MGLWKTLDEAVEQLNHQKPGKLFSAYNTLIHECGNTRSLLHGKLVQQHMNSTGYSNNQVLGELLVQMFGKCGSISDAKAVFDSLPSKKPSSWNLLVRAYAQQRDIAKTFEFFHRMISQRIAPDGYALASLANACAANEALELGIEVHKKVVDFRRESSPIVQKALISMYGKCGALDRAKEVFEQSSKQETGLWNAMIVAYAHNGHHKEALEVYKRMDFEPDFVTISSVLGVCANLGELEEGRRVYDRGKHLEDVVIDTAAVNMFGKCGELQISRRVFDSIKNKNEVTWNSMMSVYVHHGKNHLALELYETMIKFFRPSTSTYMTAIHACSGLQDLRRGMDIHARIVKEGVKLSVFLRTALMNMYTKGGKVEAVKELFDEMKVKTVVAYNVMINALSQHGRGKEAIELYKEMLCKEIVPEAATYCAVLVACTGSKDIETGREIHMEIERTPSYRKEVRLMNALISMYGRCGDAHAAKKIFDHMARDSVSWNAMISAYTQNEYGREALDLFFVMQREKGIEVSEICISTVLHTCSLLGDVQEGRRIHQLVRDSLELRDNVEVHVSLLNMYSDCGRLDLARRVFDEVSWCSSAAPWFGMVASYVKNDCGEEALRTLRNMQLNGWKPEAVTYGLVLSVCYSLSEGQRLHTEVKGNGYDTLRPVQDGLMNMYSRSGRVELAREVFDSMKIRTIISWTIMISAYEQEGMPREALDLYYTMEEGLRPDGILYATVFGACASLGALAEGMAIHDSVKESELGVFGATGLLNMYAKCGKIEIARGVFERLGSRRTYVSWTAMITAYSHHSDTAETFELCKRMVNEGVMPDGITFISLLMVLTGQPELTTTVFQSMVADYGIQPMLDHYECMVEVLGRAGWTKEAEELATVMPYVPKELTWSTLLGACGLHGDFERGENVARFLLDVGSQCSSSYVLLSNLYLAAEENETL